MTVNALIKAVSRESNGYFEGGSIQSLFVNYFILLSLTLGFPPAAKSDCNWAIAHLKDSISNSPLDKSLIESDNDTKFKTNLSFFQGQSVDFYEKIKSRFKIQKEKDPQRPYGFLMPELQSGISYMIAELALRIKSYHGEEGLYWRPRERVVRFVYKLLGQETKLRKQQESLEAELELLNLQLQDLNKIANSGVTPYDLLVRHSFWFTRVMQSTEHNKRAPIRMYPYEIFMKSDYKPAIRELTNYKQGRMDFYAQKFVLNGHKIFSPDFEVMVLPVVGPLTGVDFFHLRNTPIYMASITSKFLKADGFVLNPHTLFLHDIYFHASKLYENDTEYFQEHSFTETDIDVFRREQQKWIDKLLESSSKIKNKYLREAVLQATFTVIHDRGKTFAPSTFIGKEARNYYYVMKGEIFVASFGQLNRKLGADIKEVLKNMDSAMGWLNNFWNHYATSPY
jgi:hypothetical protein